MISWELVVIAGAITGGLAGIAAAAVRWPASTSVLAGISSLTGIIVWRAIANRAGLNGDFIPAISVADCVSFVAGGVGPLAIGLDKPPTRWVPAAVGAIVGFIVNVVVL